jgi:hypothetical protein
VIEQFKKDVKKRFNISDLGKIKKHLGIWTGEKKPMVKSTSLQPKLVKEIIESFESHMEREARDRLYQELRCNLPKNKRRRSTRS